jgi:hypothetical protein
MLAKLTNCCRRLAECSEPRGEPLEHDCELPALVRLYSMTRLPLRRKDSNSSTLKVRRNCIGSGRLPSFPRQIQSSLELRLDPTFSEQPELNRLRETHIAKQRDHQNRPVQRR